MSTKSGLLLINAGGEMFFVEQGILDQMLGESTSFADIDPNDPEIRAISNVRIEDGKLKDLEDKERAYHKLPPRSYPRSQPRDPQENLGPILFQAFNVEIETEEAGQSVVTGNGTSIDEG